MKLRHFINLFFFQLFFIRVCTIGNGKGNSPSWAIMYFVWPFLGWKKGYKCVFKKYKLFHLNKKHRQEAKAFDKYLLSKT